MDQCSRDTYGDLCSRECVGTHGSWTNRVLETSFKTEKETQLVAERRLDAQLSLATAALALLRAVSSASAAGLRLVRGCVVQALGDWRPARAPASTHRTTPVGV